VSLPLAGRPENDRDQQEKTRARAARVRRGMFLLPSLFTAGSIGAGYFAITQTIDSLTAAGNDGGASHLDWAAIAICFAIPFDALDGRIARMTNTTSEFGKELDSLADAITFGVAPCLLAWVWGFHSLPESVNPQLRQSILQIGSFVCFLYLLCGVSRLARFNISHDPQPRNPGRLDRKYFVGMPIPAAAGMIASTVHFCYGFPIPYWWLSLLWIGLVGLLGFLMVSTWRFWSGKEINFSRRQPFQLLVLLAIVLFVLIRYSSGTLFFVALAYMFSGIWARAAYSWSRRRRHMPREEAAGRHAPVFTSEYAQGGAAALEDEEFPPAPRVHEDGLEEMRPDSRPDGY
jgi:CDP-diacylglycerol---serine O-phosphatidyltransferase